MTIRETAIAQIQQLPESLVQEIIDFTTRNHQSETATYSLEGDRSEVWSRWFEATNSLEITPVNTSTAATSEYQQRSLGKYRKQGLNL